jgi:hypothetical protein
MRLALFVLFASVAACDRLPSDPATFALRLVAEARRGALPAALVDDQLVDRLRRVQLLKRVPAERMSTDGLAQLWHATAAASDGDAAARRSRAAQQLNATLGGRCDAVVDDGERSRRVAALATPVGRAPTDAQAEIGRVAAAVQQTQMIRVVCERGQAAVLLRHEDHWRVIDVYALGSAELTIAADRPQ